MNCEFVIEIVVNDRVGINNLSLDDSISTSDKYFIITGMNDKEDYIYPLITQSTSQTRCEEFLTKA